MNTQQTPQPVYELTRSPNPAPSIVQELLRRALSESQKAFTEGASLRSQGHESAGARAYIRAIGKLESAALMCLEILEKRMS